MALRLKDLFCYLRPVLSQCSQACKGLKQSWIRSNDDTVVFERPVLWRSENTASEGEKIDGIQ